MRHFMYDSQLVVSFDTERAIVSSVGSPPIQVENVWDMMTGNTDLWKHNDIVHVGAGQTFQCFIMRGEVLIDMMEVGSRSVAHFVAEMSGDRSRRDMASCRVYHIGIADYLPHLYIDDRISGYGGSDFMVIPEALLEASAPPEPQPAALPKDVFHPPEPNTEVADFIKKLQAMIWESTAIPNSNQGEFDEKDSIADLPQASRHS